jgi:hypothetical protein
MLRCNYSSNRTKECQDRLALGLLPELTSSFRQGEPDVFFSFFSLISSRSHLLQHLSNRPLQQWLHLTSYIWWQQCRALVREVL